MVHIFMKSYYLLFNYVIMKKLVVIAAIGIAIKIFIDSDKGKELVHRIQDWIEGINENVNDFFEQIADKIENAATDVDDALPGKY